tara:strand:+ start:5261 stop:5812 length:552 start_codon:yes stop_codon:yes gene_type:complete
MMKNLPNFITVSRLFFGLVVSILIFFKSDPIVILSSVLFLIGSLSDALDGAFARRQSKESTFGTFLDPIADKVFVFLVLISLVYNNDSLALFIIATTIIMREIVVMSLREWISKIGENEVLRVSSSGKIKTIIQMAGITLFISTPAINLSYFYEFTITVLILGTIMGLYSAYKYINKSFIYIK